MEIIEVATGLRKTVIISKAEDEDFKVLTKSRYSFAWRSFKTQTKVYKLQIKGKDDILGVVGLIDFPDERRIEIKLLATSRENIGKNKAYDRIAGCLIGFACRIAVAQYGEDACVSLVPKTTLVKHYMTRYHMLNAGWQLYLEGKALNQILKEYIL